MNPRIDPKLERDRNRQAGLVSREQADQDARQRNTHRARDQREDETLEEQLPVSRRRDAPTASRVASSRRRSRPRASSMPATLLHAITSTSAVSTPSRPMNPLTGADIGAGMRADGATATPQVSALGRRAPSGSCA